ncbi:MAG TPA: hypothetical protein VGM20_12605 [Gemmatimonadales bacterium]|jgi:hypothetical protein
MQLGFYAASLAAIAATVGAGATRHASQPPRLDAEVRFTNHLSGNRNWSLAANGAVIFGDVRPNETTAYSALNDTIMHLTLVLRAGDSAAASTNYKFAAGSYYTVTATYGNGVRPELAVERDRPPGDTMP